MHVDLEWNGATGYAVTTPSGASVLLDSDAREGPSPMQALLAAVAGCMAIDIVHILKRMRRAPERLSARVSGQRADDHPKRFVSIRLEFTATGGAVTQDRLEQSVELSFAKYCSVLHSLAPDTETSWSAELG
jgi:putative redox protein